MITFGQLLLAISIPSVLALIGILVNNHGLNMVRADITDLRSLNQHFIDRFLNHEGRIATVEERSKPKGTN